MSDVFPKGFYPASSAWPAMWTDAPDQPAYVQYNGLVYVKTERHTGGTGKPNEEEVNGLRTWRLYHPINQPNNKRFKWLHLHQRIEQAASHPAAGSPGNYVMPVIDELCYSYVSNYFPVNYTSVNEFPESSLTKDYRQIVYDDLIWGCFDVWIADPFFEDGFGQQGDAPNYPITSDGWYGWESAMPDSGYIPDPPPWVKTANVDIAKYIKAGSSLAVGRTYTGYLELLSKTGSWIPNDPSIPYPPYIYEYGEITLAAQIPISVTVTKEDYIRFGIEGNSETPEEAIETFSAEGAEDYFIRWGRVVLTDVSPLANN